MQLYILELFKSKLKGYIWRVNEMVQLAKELIPQTPWLLWGTLLIYFGYDCIFGFELLIHETNH